MIDNLDLKDRKILSELENNSRQSDSEIAKKVGLSRDSVSYRIKKLQDEGYIKYFMTILNTMRLGYDWYRTFFKFRNILGENENQVISYLVDNASWLTKIEGKWDLNTGIFVKNTYEYKKIIDGFLNKHGKQIESYDVAIVTRMWIYSHNFNIENYKKQAVAMGFGSIDEREIVKLDEIDYKILRVLLTNARMKTIDIARELGTTEIVVRYRINKLVQNKVIIGFKPFLDIAKLGLEYFKLHIKLDNHDPKIYDEMLKYFHTHPKTAYTTELVGGDDIEIEYQVSSTNEFYDCINEIKKKFGENIRDYFFMQYSKEYKFTYLPE